MKRLVVNLLSVLFLNTAFALPLGNPIDASLLYQGVLIPKPCDNFCGKWYDALSIRLGFYGDYVYDRHLQTDNDLEKRVQTTKIITNAGFIALNFCDRIDLFSILGASRIRISTPRKTFQLSPDEDALNLDTETGFSWSLGLRGTVLEWRCFAIGGEAQYFRTTPDVNALGENGVFGNRSDSDKPSTYYEWQVGLGASYIIDICPDSITIIPYIATQVAHAKLKFFDDLALSEAGINTVFIPNLETERYWGYGIGVTLVGCHVWSFTIEGRFVDEKALHINTQFRF